MNLIVQKNQLGGQLLFISSDPLKNAVFDQNVFGISILFLSTNQYKNSLKVFQKQIGLNIFVINDVKYYLPLMYS